MKHNGLIRVVSEQRRFNRLPYLQKVHYACGPGHYGAAACSDIGLGGMALSLGRYLRPGTRVLVTLNELSPSGEPMQFKSQVAWCRSGRDHRFRAGLRVYLDESETERALEALARRSADAHSDEWKLWSTPIPKVVMG